MRRRSSRLITPEQWHNAHTRHTPSFWKWMFWALVISSAVRLLFILVITKAF